VGDGFEVIDDGEEAGKEGKEVLACGARLYRSSHGDMLAASALSTHPSSYSFAVLVEAYAIERTIAVSAQPGFAGTIGIDACPKLIRTRVCLRVVPEILEGRSVHSDELARRPIALRRLK
jgi:hypothetical protein